jgi:hypothetical protein
VTALELLHCLGCQGQASLTALGRGGAWRQSLDCLDSTRDLMTRRARSGFRAMVVAHRLALNGTGLDLLTVARTAFQHGAPAPGNR